MMAACNHGSKASAPGCCGRPQSARTDAGVTGALANFEAGAATPALTATRFRKEEGCSRDFKTRGEPTQHVAELARLCGQGMASFFSEVFTPADGLAEARF